MDTKFVVLTMTRNYAQDKDIAFKNYGNLNGPVPGITAVIADEVVRAMEHGFTFGILQSVIVDLSTKRDGPVVNTQEHTVIVKFAVASSVSDELIKDRVLTILEFAQGRGYLLCRESQAEIIIPIQ